MKTYIIDESTTHEEIVEISKAIRKLTFFKTIKLEYVNHSIIEDRILITRVSGGHIFRTSYNGTEKYNSTFVKMTNDFKFFSRDESLS